MNRLLFFYVLIIVASCGKRTDNEFNIIRFDINNQKDSIAYENWKKENQVIQNTFTSDSLTYSDGSVAARLFYEDGKYKAYSTCRGEFGGCIFFQEKRNKNSIYYLESVCPVMIEKRKDGYYFVESLAHMGGSGRISYIETPTKLIHLNLNDLTPDWKSKKFPNLSYYEIYDKLQKQSQTIIGSYSFTLDMIFQYDEKNYTIYSKNGITMLGQIKQDTMVSIDTLFHFDAYSKRDQYKFKVNNYQHYEFFNRSSSFDEDSTETTQTEGEIYVHANNIICAFSNKTWTTKNNKTNSKIAKGLKGTLW